MAYDALALDRKNILAKNATSPPRSEASRLPPDDASADLAKTLTMEFVYVVPREEIFPDFYPQGLVRFGSDFTEEGFLGSVLAHGYFVERKHAERTPSLKQVIPYSLVLRRGELLMLRRSKRGGDARLHDKLSIGIGGHVNPEDEAQPNGVDVISAGALREIREELDLEEPYTVRRVGILNDDSNAVGAVHVGLVQLLNVEGAVSIREKDILAGTFVPPNELRRLASQEADFETWSRLLIERLGELLPDFSSKTPDTKNRSSTRSPLQTIPE